MSGAEKPVRRTFPGPRNANARLRVAVERSAYAELVAHAKSSLKAEVCGVLAGQVCEDDEGCFVGVEAMIPGTAAGEGSAMSRSPRKRGTRFHASLERDHPGLKIVGWYHTHPGFRRGIFGNGSVHPAEFFCRAGASGAGHGSR